MVNHHCLLHERARRANGGHSVLWRFPGDPHFPAATSSCQSTPLSFILDNTFAISGNVQCVKYRVHFTQVSKKHLMQCDLCLACTIFSNAQNDLESPILGSGSAGFSLECLQGFVSKQELEMLQALPRCLNFASSFFELFLCFGAEKLYSGMCSW